MADMLEIARFKVTEGADVAAAARAIDPWLAGQPGFVSRALAGPDDDGTYTDVVRWLDRQSAMAAMAAAEQSPEAARFMAIVDPTSVSMSHVELVHTS